MTYLYTGPGSFDALVGSCVRALGHGWRVIVDSKTPHMRTFTVMRELLKDPERVRLEKEDLRRARLAESKRASVTARVVLDGRHTLVSTERAWVSQGDKGRRRYDLISTFARRQLHDCGVMAFTGTGKGKTTGAIGQMMQSVIAGKPVAVVQWFKERHGEQGTFRISEHAFPEQLNDPSRVEFHPMGVGFFGSPNLDRVRGRKAYRKHREGAYAGLARAKEKIASGKYAVVVLDELIDTVAAVARNIPVDLINLNDLRRFLRFCRDQETTEVIVTGRRITDEWIDFISTSVIVTETKHPFQQGKRAIPGLDF